MPDTKKCALDKCRTPFVPARSWQKYCSARCGDLARHKKNGKPAEPEPGTVNVQMGSISGHPGENWTMVNEHQEQREEPDGRIVFRITRTYETTYQRPGWQDNPLPVELDRAAHRERERRRREQEREAREARERRAAREAREAADHTLPGVPGAADGEPLFPGAEIPDILPRPSASELRARFRAMDINDLRREAADHGAFYASQVNAEGEPRYSVSEVEAEMFRSLARQYHVHVTEVRNLLRGRIGWRFTY